MAKSGRIESPFGHMAGIRNRSLRNRPICNRSFRNRPIRNRSVRNRSVCNHLMQNGRIRNRFLVRRTAHTRWLCLEVSGLGFSLLSKKKSNQSFRPAFRSRLWPLSGERQLRCPHFTRQNRAYKVELHFSENVFFSDSKFVRTP